MLYWPIKVSPQCAYLQTVKPWLAKARCVAAQKVQVGEAHGEALQTLQVTHDRVCEENAQLRTENAQHGEETERLRKDVSQLTEENAHLHEENAKVHELHEENAQLRETIIYQRHCVVTMLGHVRVEFPFVYESLSAYFVQNHSSEASEGALYWAAEQEEAPLSALQFTAMRLD